MSGWSNCPVKATIARPNRTGWLRRTTARCSKPPILGGAYAKSRTEHIELHRQIETERFGVNQQRAALEQERRQIAGERIRDPIIAESIRAVAGLIAAILPLLVCLFLLRGLFHKSDQEALAEVLIEDLVSRQPLLNETAAVSLPGTGREPRLPAAPTEQPHDQS